MSRRGSPPLRVAPLETRMVPAMGIPKSYVVVVDGLRGDGILNANTPNLRSLIQGTWGDGPGIDYRGAYADYATTILDAPTVSGPNHTSIYTGVTAAKHGVTGNSAAQMAAVTYPDYLALLEQGSPNRRTAKLVSWDLDDLVPTGADYRRVQLEELNAQLAADMVSQVPGNAYAVATGNSDVDAIFHFFDNLDYAGHASGFTPGNPAYRSQLSTIDGLIGIVLTAIRNRPTFALEDWQIVVTSDHGGRGTSHGFAAADNYTIPFLVSSRSVGQGWLSGTPSVVDVLPTVLAHFDVPVPAHVDGVARGASVRSFPATTIDQDRVAHFSFDFNYLNTVPGSGPASVGGGSPTFVAGKFGPGVALRSVTNDWLTLGNPAALQFGASTDFSYSLWYRADSPQSGQPAILSNQNTSVASSPGFTLFGNRGSGAQIGQRMVGGSGVARAFDLVDINAGDWVFVAGSHNRSGNGMMYVGHNGVLYKLAQNILPVGSIDSALPWNIGQDGTGGSTNRLNATVDELSIWRRELRDDEVRALWSLGAGPPAPPLVAYPDQMTAFEDTPLEVAAPGLLANDVKPAVTLFSENFDDLPLGPAVEDVAGNGTDFTHAPPAGWAVDRSGVPGWGTANDGMREWAGWSFADKDYWITASGNQNRSDFTRGSGTIAVADPDEWDDAPRPAGTYNTLLTTPPVSLSGLRADSLALNFDSSFRPFANMRAFVDVSYDNFATTTRIFTRFSEDQRNEAVSIPVNNPAAGFVRFRFGLINAGNDWWWAIDNVTVTGVRLLSPITAALVAPPANGDVVVHSDGSFRYTPRPDFAGTDVFMYAATSEGVTTQAPVTVVVRPRPDVVAVRVNDGASQRSQVRSLRVEFDALINPNPLQQPGAFVLTRAGDGATVESVGVATSTFGSRTYATLTFAGANTNAGSLADGAWTLTVKGASVVATDSGLSMGPDYAQTGIRRLFGDNDGDGTVGLPDFLVFRLAFQTSYAVFDYDGNGIVDFTDFLQFRIRFLQSV